MVFAIQSKTYQPLYIHCICKYCIYCLIWTSLYLCIWYIEKYGSSWSWSYVTWIYSYPCNQCLSPLKLWVRIPFMASCTRYNIMWSSLSVTCDRSVVLSGYSGFLHQYNCPQQYSWNIVGIGGKHNKPTNHLLRNKDI